MYKVYSKHYYIYWEYVIIFCLKFVTYILDALSLFNICYLNQLVDTIKFVTASNNSHFLLIQGAHTKEYLRLLVMLCLANCLA